MAKQSHARIQRTITGSGKGRLIGAEESHVRNVTAITRRIHKLDARIRDLNALLKEAKSERREKKRELRAVLQRDSTIGPDSPLHQVSGKADAIDAANSRRER